MHYPKLEEPTFFLSSPASVEALSHFLQNALIHFQRYHSSNEKDFFKQLHIIADCYHLALVTTHSQAPVEDQRLQTFTQYIERSNLLEIGKLALALSEMIHLILEKIRLLISPWYQGQFLEALTYLFSNKIAYLQEDRKQVEKLHKRLILLVGRKYA